MAEVYRAVAIAPDGSRSTVVLKQILEHLAGDAEYYSMFVDEARIAASLDHPNIVRMLDLGRNGDKVFMVLEYVDGADMRALLARAEEIGAPISLGSALYVVREILRALEYAHSHVDPDGRRRPIIHRDVSPQNVFVSRAGEVKLLDFGIAKKLGGEDRTAIGMVKGNALYLAPEQAEGTPIDARSDVYQTGLLLLTLVCGRHPFENETLQALVERAREGRVPRVGDLRPDLPTFVGDLVAAATALDPARRYPTALAFGRFVDALAARERVLLDRPTLVRDLEWCFSAGSAITSTVSIAGAPPVAAGNLGPSRELVLETLPPPSREPLDLAAFLEALAPIASALAPDAEEEATKSIFTPPSREPVESTRVSVAMIQPEPVESTHVSIAALPAEPVESTRVSIAALAAGPQDAATVVETAVPTAVLTAHVGAIRGLSVATAGPRAISAGDDGLLRVWDLAAGGVTAEQRAHTAGVTSCALSADGSLAVTAGRDRRLSLWDLEHLQTPVTLGGHGGVLLAVAISADGTSVLAAGEDARLRLWDVARRRVTATFSGHRGAIRAVGLFSDRTRAVSASDDGTVRVWSLESGEEVTALEEGSPARALALTIDGGIVLVGREDGALSVWSIDAGARIHSTAGHAGSITALAVSPNGAFALSGGSDGSLVRWDVRRGTVIRRFAAHAGAVTSVVLAPDGEHALSSGEDGTIKGW